MQVTPRWAVASRPPRPGRALVTAALSCGPDRRRPPGYDRRVSERIADPQVVCPFVAFDDDRDFRSPVPDHRHRCFAESPAAPRALAHQAAYCLSSSFPGCPRSSTGPPGGGPPKVEAPVLSRAIRREPRPSRAAPKGPSRKPPIGPPTRAGRPPDRRRAAPRPAGRPTAVGVRRRPAFASAAEPPGRASERRASC